MLSTVRLCAPQHKTHGCGNTVQLSSGLFRIDRPFVYTADGATRVPCGVRGALRPDFSTSGDVRAVLHDWNPDYLCKMASHFMADVCVHRQLSAVRSRTHAEIQIRASSRHDRETLHRRHRAQTGSTRNGAHLRCTSMSRSYSWHRVRRSAGSPLITWRWGCCCWRPAAPERCAPQSRTTCLCHHVYESLA